MRRKKPKPVSDTPLPAFVPYKEQRETPGEFAVNMKWLEENWSNYKDLWVALDNGTLIATAENEKDLQVVVSTSPNRVNVMCLQIGKDYMV